MSDFHVIPHDVFVWDRLCKCFSLSLSNYFLGCILDGLCDGMFAAAVCLPVFSVLYTTTSIKRPFCFDQDNSDNQHLKGKLTILDFDEAQHDRVALHQLHHMQII